MRLGATKGRRGTIAAIVALATLGEHDVRDERVRTERLVGRGDDLHLGRHQRAELPQPA